MGFFGRSGNKHQNPYTLPDIYKEYSKEVEKGSPYDVTYSEFKNICNDYFRSKMEQLFKGGIFIFPFSLGTLSITKKKPKKFASKYLQIDWEATNKVGKVVHHTNDHSNYYKFKFFWSKRGTRCANKGCYSLTMTRKNKRHLAAIIKGGNTDFFEHS